MSLPVVLLWIDCVLFVGFGVGFAAVPLELAEFVTGDAPSVSSAVIDMRATYGGVAIGTGLFFGYCARRASLVQIGLVASLLVIASIGLARVVGILIDGDPNAFMIFFLALEVVFSGLTVVALRRHGSTLA